MEKFFDSFSDLAALSEKLHEPDNKYRVYPIHHELCEPGREPDKILDAELAGGAGGVVTNVTWKDPAWMYNPANTAQMKTVVSLAKERGLHVWMYDDYYYPSGFANGYAVKDHPEFMPDSIDFVPIPCKAGEALTLPEPEDCGGVLSVAVYDEKLNKLEEMPETGTVTPRRDGTIYLLYIHHQRAGFDQPLGAARGELNHLRADAVDSFILHAFGQVEQNVGLKAFDAVFTDEPTLVSHVMTFARNNGKADFICVPAPYAPDLFERYQKQWNDDLRTHLIDILGGSSRRARRTRVRYYDTVSRLAREVFTDRVASYLKAHGTLASGHFLLEEGLIYHVGYYADYMRVVGGQDIPGCDVLCADGAKFWEEHTGFGTATSFAGKYPSSISRLQGHNMTMMEICPVMYPEKVKENPFKEFMALSTYAIFSGITHYNAYGYPFIKDDAGHIALNRYVGRMLTILRNASPEAPVAVYYPISQMQSWVAQPVPEHKDVIDFFPQAWELDNDMETLSRTLYEMHTDYQFIDADHLLTAELKDGLSCGLVHAKTLLVPFCDFMTVPEALKLKAFAEAGGNVIFIQRVPRFDPAGDDEALRDALCDLDAPCVKTAKLGRFAPLLTPEMPFSLSGGRFFASPYALAGKRFLFIVNPTEEDQTLTVTGACKLYLPETDVWTDEPASFVLPAERGAMIFEK